MRQLDSWEFESRPSTISSPQGSAHANYFGGDLLLPLFAIVIKL